VDGRDRIRNALFVPGEKIQNTAAGKAAAAGRRKHGTRHSEIMPLDAATYWEQIPLTSKRDDVNGRLPPRGGEDGFEPQQLFGAERGGFGGGELEPIPSTKGEGHE
jgi:hypothetical protein